MKFGYFYLEKDCGKQCELTKLRRGSAAEEVYLLLELNLNGFCLLDGCKKHNGLFTDCSQANIIIAFLFTNQIFHRWRPKLF